MSSSYVNVKKEYTGTGDKDPIQLNRWSRDNYTVQITVTGTIDITVAATLDYINRNGADDPVWSDISTLTNITADAFEKIVETPAEALRVTVNSGAGSVVVHVMQSGEG